MHLDEPELFITLILKYLAKESDFMVIFEICPNSMNDCACPLYNETFKTILLVEIGVHILLHCLDWKFTFSTFDIIFYLLLIDVVDYIFKLFKRKNFRIRRRAHYL